MRRLLYPKAVSVLRRLARKKIEKYQPKVIAITGSIGKTSTAMACKVVLEDSYRVWVDLESSYQDTISIPLSILGIKKPTRNKFELGMLVLKTILFNGRKNDFPEVFIFELRTRKPGDISKLMSIIGKIDCVVYTTISEIPSHLEFFSDIKEYVHEKQIASKYLKNDGFAVYNFDSEYSRKIGEKIKQKKRSIGFDGDADYFAENPHLISGSEWGGIGFKFHYEEQKSIPIKLPHIIAFHQVYAALNAIAIGYEFEINLVEISKRLAQFISPKHRMEIVRGRGEITIIDDAYNASPDSTKAALSTLHFLNSSRRKVAVLGDMLELGEKTEEGHREVGGKAAEVADCLVTFGKNARIIADEAKKNIGKEKKMYHFNNLEDLLTFLPTKIISKNDIVLVKGSRKMEMERVVDALQ